MTTIVATRSAMYADTMCSYTVPFKVNKVVRIGNSIFAGAGDTDELETFFSLQLGGAPDDPANLWPEPYAGPCGARRKDRIETALKRQVCAGKITLKQAQDAIRTNWIEAYRKYVGPLQCGE